MDLHIYRQHQLEAIAEAEAQIDWIEKSGARYFERTIEAPHDVEVTDTIVSRHRDFISQMNRAIAFIDGRLAGDENPEL